jgi:integrase
MHVYYYKRKLKDGTEDPRWSYRIKSIPTSFPIEAWPEGFKTTGTKFTIKKATVDWVEQKIAQAELRAHSLAMGKPLADDKDILYRIDQYIEHGKVKGGVKGLPWAEDHANHVKTYLMDWKERLNLKSINDIRQSAFIQTVIQMSTDGTLAPNTINHRARVLTGFCKHMVYIQALDVCPIHYKSLDKTPVNPRGYFTPYELSKIIAVAPTYRAILYHFASLTGLRKSSIATITVSDFSFENQTVTLFYRNVKSRKPTVKPLTQTLCKELRDMTKGLPPGSPLFPLHNPKQAVKRLQTDMERAGVPIMVGDYKRDFHSLKSTLATSLDGLGTSPAIMQQALDHSEFSTTQGYIHREIAPIRLAAELVEAVIFKTVTHGTQSKKASA